MTPIHSATRTFGLLALVEAILFWIAEPLPHLLLAAGTAFIVGGLVGRVMWKVIVDSSDRWTLPIRGALAGGLTGWISISPIAMVLFTVGQYSSITGLINSLASPTAFAEFAFGFVLLGVIGTFVVGWITVPTAAITGYVLGREVANKGAPTEK
jgi:hypothetical protein